MIRIAVYGTHNILKEGLEGLVTSVGFCIVSETEAEVGLWELCSQTLPYPSPTHLPSIAVLDNDPKKALEVLSIGYRGYLHSSSSSAHLKGAVQAVLRGEIWAERHILSEAFKTVQTPHLTLREREVFSLVSQGLSNKEIAQRLGISENTVKGHVSHLLAKLEVKNRARAAFSQHRKNL